MVIVCIYQRYPVTADGRTPQYAFTSRVDPVSAPYSLVHPRLFLEAATAARGQFREKLKMVELPGTAPGSTTAIPQTRLAS